MQKTISTDTVIDRDLFARDQNAPITFHMALDEVVFERAQAQQIGYPLLRLYQCDRPSITVGCCQRICADAKIDAFIQQGWALTRRITGGGTVYHDNDLIFSVCMPDMHQGARQSITGSYRLIHTIVASALDSLGLVISLCDGDSTGNRPEIGECFVQPVTHDILYDGGKIVGGAQRRRNGYVLHQGSVQIPGLHDRMTHDQLRAAVKESFIQHIDAKEVYSIIDEADRHRAHEREQRKYASYSWIYRR